MSQFQTQLEDKLHFFVEECDRLQGFHLLCDWTNGFGGLAGCIAQDLRDEYNSKGILTVLSSPLDTALNKVGVASCNTSVVFICFSMQLPKFYPSILNHILSLNHLCSPSSAVLPLSPLSQPWQAPSTLREINSLSFNVRALPLSQTCVFFFLFPLSLSLLPGLEACSPLPPAQSALPYICTVCLSTGDSNSLLPHTPQPLLTPFPLRHSHTNGKKGI